ncbi:MAG TPA: M48 family metallopeptidase [archaeon]|nr:M48 family metallopeptidase [archaeon]
MEKVSFYDQISKNKRNSILLTLLVFSFLVSIIYVIGLLLAPELSLLFLAFAFLSVIVYTYGTYSYGDRIVLAATNAKPIKEDDKRFAQLNNVVEEMSIAAGIQKPKLYVIESDEVNAFATGKDPNNSSIAVTTGLLNAMKRDELTGVIGHEMSHIRNYDIRFATLVAVMVGLIAIVSYMFLRSWRFSRSRDDEGKGAGIIILAGFVLAIFAPIIVRIVQAAVSRRRELLADASSAELTRYPEGLASALEKIMKTNQGKLNVSEAVSHLFFTDPNKSSLDSLYATHPPLKERIRILRAM